MRILSSLMLITALFFSVALQAESVGTSFTYQGELQQSGIPADGNFDFQFELYDADSGGVALSAPVALESVSVQEGIFQVDLDFGLSPFTGDQLWLEIRIKRTGVSGTIILEPRQKLTATPFAIKSLVAETVPEGSITSQEINTSSVQTRVAGVCSGGFAMRAVNADGSVVCEADSDTVLSESEVDAFVANNGYSMGAHTVDTTLTEAQVDSYVANNGYGDITAVTTAADSGLTGGSSSGNVALSVSGVTTAMITDETITGSDIDTSTTISAADFTYSSVRTGYAFISPLSCKQYNNATGTVDANVYFKAPPSNSHGPFLQLRDAEGAGTYNALCRTDIPVPPTSTVNITGATLMFADQSAACLVGGGLKGKQNPANTTTAIASVYSGTSSSDLATIVGYNQTKAFPAFSAYPVTQSATSATDVFFELVIEQNEPASLYCRFIGVQLAYTVNKP